MNTSAIVLAWPMLSIIVDKSYASSTIMVAIELVIHNCAVLGLFALETLPWQKCSAVKPLYLDGYSKEIGDLIASGFGLSTWVFSAP